MSFKKKLLPLALAQVIAGGAFSVLSMAPAMAQEATTDTAAAPVQRIEITGSSIKRASVEGALPIQVLTHEDIAKTGATSTEQLLTYITSNSNVGANNTAEGVGASTYGEANAALRGLGADHTLVLVDGHRLANYATDGLAVDINAIPISLIDRVEVLKDGASAVYGSDAIAGVINFITRKNFQGTEVTGYAGGSKDGGGSVGKFGVITGLGDYDTDHYNLTLSADYDKEGTVYGSQRSYAQNSWDNGGLYDTSATPSGAIRTFDPVTTPNSGGVIPNALNSQGAGIGNPLSPNNCAANGSAYDPNIGTCRFNPSPLVPLLPQVTRENVSVNLRVKLNENAEFFLQGFDSHNLTDTKEQPSPYSVSFLATDQAFATKNIYPAIIVSPTSPYYPAAYIAANMPSAAGQPITVSYRAYDAGGRDHTDIADQSHLVTGFKGTFKDYDYEVSYSHNSSSVAETTQGGYQSQTALAQLLSNNNAFNPFTQYQTPALAAQIAATNYNGAMMNSTLATDAFDGKISGTITKLPAGDLSFAVGAVLRDESLEYDPSAAFQSGDISGYGGQALPINASRHSSSIFGELDIPILKNLEADVAVRDDKYPNATSTNPKIGLRYQPIQQLLLRASYGTGFREPGLPELYNPNTIGTTATFKDPVTGVTNQWTQTTGGNVNLKPEKSEQSSFGFVVDPIKDMSMSVDYYRINISNLVTTLDPQFTVDQAATGNPTYASLVTRDSLGNITNIMATNINAGSEKTSGFDVDARWKFLKTADFGNYSVHLNGSYTSKFNLTTPAGVVQHSVADTVDQNGNPLNVPGVVPRWKHELTFDWTKGPYSLDLTQNFQTGYWDNIPCCTAQTTPAHVGSFETWDIQGSYSGIKNLTLSAGVKNLFDRNPPLAITLGQYFQAGWDPSYYDPRSEFIYATARYKF